MVQQIRNHGFTLKNILHEDLILKNSTISMSQKFTNFGTLSAGLIGIIIIVPIIQFVTETFIHGYILHSIFI